MQNHNINPNFNPATEKQLDHVEQISNDLLSCEQRIQVGRLINSCSGLFKFIVSHVPPLSVFEAIDLYFTKFQKKKSPIRRKQQFGDYENQMFFVLMYMFLGSTFKDAVNEIEELKETYTDGKIESFTSFDYHYHNNENFRSLVNKDKKSKFKK
ncbi:hypothetical protein [Colwellia polaris]|uniref:hypothetical protein n=1 Tax=Colwellia polaris TaxID=326537 RepID=UPI000A177D8C|nr:hypothetical protein [Colwellia polaris]